MTNAARLLLGVALALALAACSGADTEAESGSDTSTVDSPSSTPSTTPSADPSVAPAQPAPLEVFVVSGGRGLSTLVADTAGDGTEELAGKIIVAERGCLHVTRRTGPPTLLVLPPGAEMETDRRPTLLLDGARYPVGTPIQLTGEIIAFDADQAAAARPCVVRGQVFRVATVS